MPGRRPGVVNLVMGPAQEIADEMLENPICRKISFTGSTEVGKQLMKGCADQVKRVSLELGGHAPFIVFPDADPEDGRQDRGHGQVPQQRPGLHCPQPFLRPQGRAKEIHRGGGRVRQGAETRQRPGRRASKWARCSSKRPWTTPLRWSKTPSRCGAKILTGGKRSDKFAKGYFFEPTVLTGLTPQVKMMTEEPFAPVMPLLDFSKIDDVIREANNTRYGLAAYVFTNDLSVAWKMAEGLEAGIIGINDPVPAAPQCPFGGMKESGLGRELGHEGLDAYLETKYVSFKLRD